MQLFLLVFSLMPLSFVLLSTHGELKLQFLVMCHKRESVCFEIRLMTEQWTNFFIEPQFFHWEKKKRIKYDSDDSCEKSSKKVYVAKGAGIS